MLPATLRRESPAAGEDMADMGGHGNGPMRHKAQFTTARRTRAEVEAGRRLVTTDRTP